MGSTKPQLFAIQNEHTPAPDSGGDGPPSGEHETGAHATVVTGPPIEVQDSDPREKPTLPPEQAPEQAHGFMRDISKPERSNLTDADHKNGVLRWEIAKLTESEWRRALAHNDREIAETTPGSEDFARLMEARHRMAFPPPKGVKYDDISRYHADLMRKELQAVMPKKPRFDRRWILLGIGFLALLTVGVIVVVPALRDGPAPEPSGAPPAKAPTAGPAATAAPEPDKTVAPAQTEEPAQPVTAQPVTTERPASPPQKSSAPVTTQAPAATTSPPSTATAAPSSANTPYFLPKSKSP